MRFRSAILATIILATQAAPFQAASPQRLPVGRLTCHAGGQQTTSIGSVIQRRDLLLVAGHFADAFPTGTLPVCAFKLQLAQGKSWRATAVPLVFGGGRVDRRLTPATDWAIMQLDRPLPASHTPVALSAISDPLTDHIWLYRTANQDKARFDLCTGTVSRPGSLTLLHDCKTRSGESGSPMVVFSDGRAELFAIHTGVVRTGGAGSILAGRVARQISELPTD